VNDLFENSLADSLGKLAETAPLAPDADRILAALGRRKARRIGWAVGGVCLACGACVLVYLLLLTFPVPRPQPVVTARTQVPPPRQQPQAALTAAWPTMTMAVPSVPGPGAEGRIRLEAPKFAVPTAIAVDHPAPSFGLPETGIRFPNL